MYESIYNAPLLHPKQSRVQKQSRVPCVEVAEFQSATADRAEIRRGKKIELEMWANA